MAPIDLSDGAIEYLLRHLPHLIDIDPDPMGGKLLNLLSALSDRPGTGTGTGTGHFSSFPTLNMTPGPSSDVCSREDNTPDEIAVISTAIEGLRIHSQSSSRRTTPEPADTVTISQEVSSVEVVDSTQMQSSLNERKRMRDEQQLLNTSTIGTTDIQAAENMQAERPVRRSGRLRNPPKTIKFTLAKMPTPSHVATQPQERARNVRARTGQHSPQAEQQPTPEREPEQRRRQAGRKGAPARLRGGVWTPECNRNGDRPRRVRARRTRDVDPGEGTSEGATWRTDGIPPDLGEHGFRLLMQLSCLGGPSAQRAITSMLETIQPASTGTCDTHLASPGHDIPLPMSQAIERTTQLAKMCQDGENDKRKVTFKTLLAYLELTIQVDHIMKHASQYNTDWINLTRVYDGLQNQESFAFKTYESFRQTFHKGLRLACLAEGGSLYILLVIAAADMDRKFLNFGNSIESEIAAVSYMLRALPETDQGGMVQSAVLPHLLQIIVEQKKTEMFRLTVPDFDETGKFIERSIHFSELSLSDKYLARIENYIFKLPARSIVWNTTSATPVADSGPFVPAETVEFVLPFVRSKTKCPVNHDNRDAWTACHRDLASKAENATSAEDLTSKISERGKAKLPYIGVDPKICEGKTYKFCDSKKAPQALLFTDWAESKPPLLQSIVPTLRAHYPEEIFLDNSRRLGWKFLTDHFQHGYFRSSENGEGAPADIHPNLLHKGDKSKVNHGQRLPYPSKDITQDPETYTQVSEIFANLFAHIYQSIKHQLPDDCQELEAYIQKLPLGANVKSYPFGGFVLNISACTRAHRDPGDKKLCVVVPFGDWVGGELCLHELGLVFQLRPGDILVFRSDEITHFNLHFKGIRISLAISSDKAGDSWVKNRHGWFEHMKEK